MEVEQAPSGCGRLAARSGRKPAGAFYAFHAARAVGPASDAIDRRQAEFRLSVKTQAALPNVGPVRRLPLGPWISLQMKLSRINCIRGFRSIEAETLIPAKEIVS